MDFWPRIVFHTLFQFKHHIIKSNYALNFIIFNIMLAIFSSSVLSQLYPSSLTVSTFSGGSASHHLWDLAFLFYFLAHSLLVLFTMLWQRHCNQHCFSWHKLGPNAFGHWGEEVVATDWGQKTIFDNCKFCRNPRSASAWARSFGAAQETMHSHPRPF